MEVSSYKQGEVTQLVDLLELVFGSWPFVDLSCQSIEYWKWKYLDNPTGLVNVGLAWEENELLGCNHVYYVRVKMGDKTFLCGNGTDSAVHPDHRNKGIYTKINEHTKKHGCFL